RSHARYGHANLLTDAFLTALKNKIIRESLQSGALPICQRSRLGPMVDMSTATAAAGYSISRLLRIKPLINLAYLCSTDIQLQMFGQISSKCVLTGFDISKPLNNSRRLFCKVIVGRIFRDRR